MPNDMLALENGVLIFRNNREKVINTMGNTRDPQPKRLREILLSESKMLPCCKKESQINMERLIRRIDKTV